MRPDIGEVSLTVLEMENLVLENGKKSEFLAFQKVAKNGNIGKKVQQQAVSII